MTFLFSNILVGNEELLLANLDLYGAGSRLVLLNTAVPLQCAAVRAHRNKILVRRWHRKSSSYLGAANAEGLFEAVYFLEGPKHNLPNAPWLETYPGFPDLIPTTGFWVWRIFSASSSPVMLVNFLGPNDNTTMKAPCHNWDFEHDFVRSKHPAEQFLDVTRDPGNRNSI